MKTDLHRRVANELQTLEQDARQKRSRYAVGSSLYAYFDGMTHAYRDLRIMVQNGDFAPLDDVDTPTAEEPASWERLTR